MKNTCQNLVSILIPNVSQLNCWVG